MNDLAFRKAITVSLIGHAFLVILLLCRTFFLPSESLDLKNSIRVDMVGLPDKIRSQPEASAPTAPQPVKIAKPETPKEGIKPGAKVAEKKALDRLKAMEAIDKLKTSSDAPQKPKEQTFKGNVVNSGDSLSGLEKIQFNEYFTAVKNKLRENFHLPKWLVDANLRAQAMALIDENGFVIHREIVKSSGNDVFDGMILDSIDKSSPFTPPPARLKTVLQFKGVVFNFPD